MKKILIIVLTLALIAGSLFALSSCEFSLNSKDEGDDGKSIPKADPDAAKAALEASGFEVDLEAGEDVQYLGLTGLKTLVFAQGNRNDEYEAIYILYYESAEALEKDSEALDLFFGDLETSADEEGFLVTSGKADDYAWIGTELAIKAASGEKVTGVGQYNPGDDPNDGPIDGTVPGTCDHYDNTNDGECDECGMPMKDSSDDDGINGYEYVEAALIDAGYEVSLELDDLFDTYGINDLEAVIFAMNDELDTIYIFYFESVSALEGEIGPITSLLNELKMVADEFGPSESHTIGRVAFIGSPKAIYDSQIIK